MSDPLFPWRVVSLAALAVLLLVAGFLILILPESSEGPLVLRISTQHTVRVADLVGGGLLLLGSLVAWWAGASWQQKMYAS